jgi:ATP-dependent RNA helicase SUPV3L1/SUV3
MGQDHRSRSVDGDAGRQRPDRPAAEALPAVQAEQRRRGWRSRLETLARQAEALPVRRDDLEVAAAGISDPDVGDAGLLAALREAVLARLGGYGTPETALAAALEKLPKGPAGEASLEAVGHCARFVAEAFALSAPDAAGFAQRTVEAERQRRIERRSAARAARETRAKEEQRLSDCVGGQPLICPLMVAARRGRFKAGAARPRLRRLRP